MPNATPIGSGPFARMERWNQSVVLEPGNLGSVINFDASLANTMYSAADTVQPNTLRTYCLIRYA